MEFHADKDRLIDLLVAVWDIVLDKG